MADGRVSQVVVELLTQPPPPAARVTQVVVEILTASAAPPAGPRAQPFILLPV